MAPEAVNGRSLIAPAWVRLVACCLGTLIVLLLAGPARAAQVSQNIRFTASDGVSLQTTVTGEGALAPRPVIVEFSPYGRNSGTFKPGPDYNPLIVQIRGILGTSAASLPGLPAIDTVRVGGPGGSRLLLPILPAR